MHIFHNDALASLLFVRHSYSERFPTAGMTDKGKDSVKGYYGDKV